MIYWLDNTPADAPVGGKAAGLARLMQAGFPVPPGYCVTSTSADVLTAFDRLGAGPVAVRSSALAEDGVRYSFAGQHLTLLNIERSHLVEAIDKVMGSAAGSTAYRDRMGLSGETMLPVIIQSMLQPTTAGVLFTRSPDNDGQMLLEAATGLGEAVVSGQVTPDQYRYQAGTWSREARQGGTDLGPAILSQLADLATRVERLLGGPQDIEWAEVDGRVWLLQARPITSAGRGVRPQEIAHARSLAAPEGTAWSRYSLSESLPAPRPMTWSLVRSLMSGSGAFGHMYRDLGYDPDPALDQDGVLDLIAGRAWYNLSRETRMYFRDFPYRHPLAGMKADARKGLYPVPEVSLENLPAGFWGRLPRTVWRMMAAAGQQRRARSVFLETFVTVTVPAWMARIEQAPDMAVDDWWTEVNTFAREALKASAFAVLAMEALRGALRPGDPSLAALLVGATPVPGADVGLAFRQAARGELEWPALLAAVGHRGAGEMELAQPRWREDPAGLKAALEGHVGVEREPLCPPSRLARPVAEARRWMGLREAARHWLMAGWAETRRRLVALGDQTGVGDGIFDLQEDEIPALLRGEDFSAVIDTRRKYRMACLALECPEVLFSDDLEAIGRAGVPADGSLLQGQGVSPGQATGPAMVRYEPGAPVSDRGFVLICPSTDPGWTPLMLKASALVMERGGILSHGAIIAREAGVPAVVGIPGLMSRIEEGMPLQVDGDYGTVTFL